MIAILGATGTLGRSLAKAFIDGPRGLALFARNPAVIADEFSARAELRFLEEFSAADYDLVINAIGAGDPARVASLGTGIIEITERWDRRVLETMGGRTRYVFLSSGAVYGANSNQRIATAPQVRPPIDHFAADRPYADAKLLAELRHRDSPERMILDLRVFGYADETLPQDGRFFLSQLARSITAGRPFQTSTSDMVRDYAGRAELAELISCWERSGAPNLPLDLYTRRPASKYDVLTLARERFGVDIEYRSDSKENPSNPRPTYASRNFAAAAFGYDPKRESIEVVADFLDGAARSWRVSAFVS